tara:strand:- start:4705 stop:5763 length:1059 start_codon:yes stop_codon:yes gene_type:complete
MSNKLLKAREFAESIRFSGDESSLVVEEYKKKSNELKSFFYSNELAISKDVTPDLYDSLINVYSRLGVNHSEIEAFVYASPHINAECYSTHSSNCVIRFSSSLVDILSKDEFEFVVGHELGHFLLSHHQPNENNANAEYYIQQRAQEISADRLGLVACNSLDIALKALLKTVSGLNDKHLRFDIGSFISQLKKVNDNNEQRNLSTHPSIIIRCRALLWFSMNTSYINNRDKFYQNELLSLDSKIKNDLSKYSDGNALNEISIAKENLAMWSAAYKIIQDGKFTKVKQKIFSDTFGQENLEKLINFINDVDLINVNSSVIEKLDLAKRELKALIPNNYSSEFNAICKTSEKLF